MKKNLKYIFILLVCILTTIIPTEVLADVISLNKSTITLGVGYSETIKYTLSDGLNSSNIIWKSSNEKVATVQNGKINAITEGTAIITASINGKSSTCKVKVSSEYIPVTGISLNKSSLNILIGTTETLIKSISPSNATNKDVTWHSSNTDIATISQSGQITAKKLGTTTITVSTSSGYRTTCRVTVIDTVPLKGININKTNITIKEKSTDSLSITYNPSNATNKNVTWRSSNTNVATVNSSGKVTGITPGTATITAVSNDSGHVATCKVTVEALSKKVSSISLNKKELNLIIDEEETLKATITPDYAENKNVTWESGDKKIANVENGIVKAISPGTTEIKVISEDGEKEAICKITVTAPPVKKISFSETTKNVYISSKTQLKLIKEPTNSTFDNAVWTSSNEEIATVEDGIVNALSIGKTIITVSNEDKTITASIEINVINKPKEKINIAIEGYNLNFDPNIKNYELEIKNEDKLTITTNVEKTTINGNQNLKNGSIITITLVDKEKATYVINIKKKQNYTIYFIAAISVLLLINLIRIIVKNKKKKY